MPRTYSQELIDTVNKANPNYPGVALAKACIQANLPSKYVAVALKVTRMTLYSWFRGKPIRFKNQQIVVGATSKTSLIYSQQRDIIPFVFHTYCDYLLFNSKLNLTTSCPMSYLNKRICFTKKESYAKLKQTGSCI